MDILFSDVPDWQASGLVSLATFLALLIVAMLLDVGRLAMRERASSLRWAAGTAAVFILPAAFGVALYYLIYACWLVLLA